MATAATMPEEHAARMNWEDLALLDGFRQGLAQAAAIVQRALVTRLAEVLTNHGATPSEADDLIQERLCGLLDPMSCVSYAGRGPLIGWLRKSLLRDLSRLRAAERRHSKRPAMTVSAPPSLFDIEGAFVGNHYRPHLRAMLREVFLELEPDDRRVLRLVHHGGLSAQQVAVLMGLHRVTVQRRLGELRDAIDRGVRKRLGARFGLDATAIRALFDPDGPAYETALSSILATPAPDG